MATLRLDSVNGSPVVEYRTLGNQPVPYTVTVQRRALTADGGEYRDGSEWHTVTLGDVASQMRLGGPVGAWLAKQGVTMASVVRAVGPGFSSEPAYVDIYEEVQARVARGESFP